MAYRWSFNASRWEPTHSELSTISRLIQPEEKGRIRRFVFIRDAKSSLIGRLLIRKLIQLKTHVPNHLFKLGRDDHNKPILISPPQLTSTGDLHDCNLDDNSVHLHNVDLESGDPNSNSTLDPPPPLNSLNLNFNISHQGSFVVLASDPHASLIGIDVMNVEKPGRIADTVDEYFRLMSRQFTDSEWRQIKGLDSPVALSDKKKMINFTRFWCLKEAYVKAIGVGIVIDLRTVDFKTKTDLDAGGGGVVTDTVVKVGGVLETGWEFEERTLDETHLVAVAKKLKLKNAQDSVEEGVKMCRVSEFEEVSLDFLLEDMSPLEEEEDKEWVTQFLQKNKKK